MQNRTTRRATDRRPLFIIPGAASRYFAGTSARWRPAGFRLSAGIFSGLSSGGLELLAFWLIDKCQSRRAGKRARPSVQRHGAEAEPGTRPDGSSNAQALDAHTYNRPLRLAAHHPVPAAATAPGAVAALREFFLSPPPRGLPASTVVLTGARPVGCQRPGRLPRREGHVPSEQGVPPHLLPRVRVEPRGAQAVLGAELPGMDHAASGRAQRRPPRRRRAGPARPRAQRRHAERRLVPL